MIRDVLGLKGYNMFEAGDGVEAANVEAGLAGPIHLLLTPFAPASPFAPDLR